MSRLLKKYGTFLRAWKICLDRDGDNRCTWDEFRDACKDIAWSEDVPGERFVAVYGDLAILALKISENHLKDIKIRGFRLVFHVFRDVF